MSVPRVRSLYALVCDNANDNVSGARSPLRINFFRSGTRVAKPQSVKTLVIRSNADCWVGLSGLVGMIYPCGPKPKSEPMCTNAVDIASLALFVYCHRGSVRTCCSNCQIG